MRVVKCCGSICMSISLFYEKEERRKFFFLNSLREKTNVEKGRIKE